MIRDGIGLNYKGGRANTLLELLSLVMPGRYPAVVAVRVLDRVSLARRMAQRCDAYQASLDAGGGTLP
jgi:hypothetical protein